jgi:hypothetical protein
VTDRSGRIVWTHSGPVMKRRSEQMGFVPGRGSGFSVEAPRGVRFLIRSRLFTDQESAQLELEGNPPTGPAETALPLS